MGYYSKVGFSIHPDPTTKELDQIKKSINEDALRFRSSGYFMNQYVNFLSDDEYKFYEWDIDMKYLSRQYPNFIFRSYRQGENDEDKERIDYQNGEVIGKYIGIVHFKEVE